MSNFKHVCDAEHAPRIAEWVRTRDGIAVWRNVDLMKPGESWTTPVLDETGHPSKRPSYSAANLPDIIIRAASEIGVQTSREVKRFKVAVRRGSQGLSLKLTDESAKKVREEIDKAGEGAYCKFDYCMQEAVILAPDSVQSLSEWIEASTKESN